MKEEILAPFIALVTVVFSFIGASIIWILFNNEIASFITFLSCIGGSLFFIYILNEWED